MVEPENIEKRLSNNRRFDTIFAVIGLISTFVGMITLAALLFDLSTDGLGRISFQFFVSLSDSPLSRHDSEITTKNLCRLFPGIYKLTETRQRIKLYSSSMDII